MNAFAAAGVTETSSVTAVPVAQQPDEILAPLRELSNSNIGVFLRTLNK